MNTNYAASFFIRNLVCWMRFNIKHIMNQIYPWNRGIFRRMTFIICAVDILCTFYLINVINTHVVIIFFCINLGPSCWILMTAMVMLTKIWFPNSEQNFLKSLLIYKSLVNLSCFFNYKVCTNQWYIIFSSIKFLFKVW